MKGFLLIDKGEGLSSFDVIKKIRKAVNLRGIGHAGTLDPLASGLMIVAVGEATKLLEYFIGFDKEYVVKARFGAVSATFDREGPIVEVEGGVEVFTKRQIEKVIKSEFSGEISQVPPKYSAIKIAGKKAVDLVRKGFDVELKARKVKIDEFKIMDFAWPEVTFRIKCESGTYIRSLVHDLGQRLGCGAYVLELRRTKIGKFSVPKGCCAIPGESFYSRLRCKIIPGEVHRRPTVVSVEYETDLSNKNIEQCFVSLEDATKDFKKIKLSAADYNSLKLGRILSNIKVEQGVPTLATYEGKVVGILENFYKYGVKFRKMIL
ncbi:MAG: tRNA pseudouridine(55) synthase TruB [Patescibacteria group bacterium]